MQQQEDEQQDEQQDEEQVQEEQLEAEEEVYASDNYSKDDELGLWTCKMCTFSNIPEHTSCVMCETDKGKRELNPETLAQVEEASKNLLEKRKLEIEDHKLAVDLQGMGGRRRRSSK